MSDLISRQDAIKTVIRMCSPICDWELEKKAYTDCVIDEINSLPSATCDDCIWHVCNYNKIDWDGEDGYISRQDAIDEIKALYEWHDTVTEDRAVDHLKRLPSAEPKAGEWIDCRKGCNYYANCSNCGMQIDVRERGGYPNFCENCGAKMRGADDEREDIQSTDE